MQYWRKIVQALVQAVQRNIAKTTKYQRLRIFYYVCSKQGYLIENSTEVYFAGSTRVAVL